MRYRATSLVLVACGLLGCGGSDEVLPEVRTPAPITEDAASPASSPSATGDTAGPGVYEGEVDGAVVSVDLTDSATGPAADAAALAEAVGGSPVTFVAATVDNGSDAPVTLESVEITDDTDTEFSLSPAATVLGELRSAINPYDTETFERATQLLEAAEQQTSTTDPGESTGHLLVTEGAVSTPVEVTVVGSFGRLELQRS